MKRGARSNNRVVENTPGRRKPIAEQSNAYVLAALWPDWNRAPVVAVPQLFIEVYLPRLRLARPSQFEGLTGAKPFRISEGYPRVFTTEKGGGDLFWRDLGGLDPGRRLRGECDPSLVQ